jgi:rubrerythrin
MFSVEDICNIAIQIEKNGEKAYRDAQAKANDAKLKESFKGIADDEKRHIRWFQNLARNIRRTTKHPQIKELGKSLLQDIIGNQTFSLTPEKISQAATIEQIIKQSIEFEKDTIIFYEMVSKFIDDEAIIAQIELIIEEERRHVNTLRTNLGSKGPNSKLLQINKKAAR